MKNIAVAAALLLLASGAVATETASMVLSETEPSEVVLKLSFPVELGESTEYGVVSRLSRDDRVIDRRIAFVGPANGVSRQSGPDVAFVAKFRMLASGRGDLNVKHTWKAGVTSEDKLQGTVKVSTCPTRRLRSRARPSWARPAKKPYF